MRSSHQELYCCATEGLVHRPTSFYPIKIPVPHHQLRHFVSTTEQDRIYYAYRHDIYTLSLETNQRCLVATLPFDARCLAAAYGWICVGGEVNGNCAFLKIQRNGQADALQDPFALFGHPKVFGHDLVMKELGGEIVNAIKIHKWSSLRQDQDEILALICNNDRSVKIYSLDQQRVLQSLDHPVSMNYSCMSPDSSLLLTVGDTNEVYFYKQIEHAAKAKSSSSSLRDSERPWTLIGTASMPFGESIGDDYSFSVTFSPSGQLCAVSSQGGYISILNMKALESSNHYEVLDRILMCSFRSSRSSLSGYVRSMEFSPEPWDLFAWVEDHGRLGIADLRSGFVRRQILTLNSSSAEINRVEVEDTTPLKYKGLSLKQKLQHQHVERLKIDPTHYLSRFLPHSNPAAEAWADELRNRQQNRHLYIHGADLDARERSVLEALETTMDEVEDPSSAPMFNPDSAEASIAERDESGPSIGGVRGELAEVAPTPQLDISGDLRRQSGSRYHPPRRRSSVILSPSNASRLALPTDESRTRFSVSPSRMNEQNESTEFSAASVGPTTLVSINDLMLTRDNHSSQSSSPDTAQAADGASNDATMSLAAQRSSLLGSALNANRYSAHLRSEANRRYSGDAETEADLEAHLTEYSAHARARAAASSTYDSIQQQRSTAVAAAASTRRSTQDDFRRRQQLADVDSLQRQIGRSENRVAIARSNIEALENSLAHGGEGQRYARILEARTQARARAAANAVAGAGARQRGMSTSVAVARDLERLRSTTEASIPSNTSPSTTTTTTTRAEAGRRMTELSSRISESDMRLARLEIMSDAQEAIDRNGNWAPSQRLRDVSSRPTEGNIANLIEDMVNEMGPGTAGVGWSPDGRHLYVGTEEGIFGYSVNMQNRMQFPSYEMR